MNTEMKTENPQRVGILGLGIMGTAYAQNLLNAGFKVSGFDISSAQCQEFESLGGKVLDSPSAIAENNDVVLIALASTEALTTCIDGNNGLVKAVHPEIIICEMGTFSVQQKEVVKRRLEPLGAKVLDCPVSGTGAQAAKGDLSVYMSGDENAANAARPVFNAIARDVRYVGPFGTGMKLKLIANLLVTVHNLAAAEALLFAKQSGLDLQMVYEAICAGGGTSRMFEVRGPMMIDNSYEPATMTMDVYVKDLQLIMDHARETNCPTPLMMASLPYYVAAIAQGRGHEDTASLYGVLQNMTDQHST